MDGGTRDAKPLIALAMGDPAGISPELTAKAVGLDEVHSRARLIVVGDRRVFNEGMRTAGANTDVKTVAPDAFVEPHDNEPIFVDLANLDPASISCGVAARQGGLFALENYRYALEFARDGRVDAVCFTPFNKKAMRLARPVHASVIFNARKIRVTSHIPLAEVPARLTHAERRLPMSADCGRWPQPARR
jgi:4-hydroxythreonine-4-phosphate dehydrogenase